MVPIIVATVALLALGLKPAAAAEVSYYDVPRGAHPHDVAPAPDGTVWYTAQSQGALGILDPKTGKVTQIPLGPGAAPRENLHCAGTALIYGPVLKTGHRTRQRFRRCPGKACRPGSTRNETGG